LAAATGALQNSIKTEPSGKIGTADGIRSDDQEGAMNKPDSTRKPHANLPLGMERRATPRFGCDRGVQCWKDGYNHAAIWGTFIDLSVTGCSIQTPTPIPPGTRLSMVFTLYGSSIRIGGEVRTLHGAVMGVAFKTMTKVEHGKLSAAVQRLAGGKNTGSEVIMNTQATVLRLQRWFKENDLLTRAIFQRLLDGSFDPALESSASTLVDRATAHYSLEKAAAEISNR
jgi:hypothetical protein